ncbi:two-component system, chemotaxis family, CheB/CheR fusion protein [Faunimonas pinastri]|uniref:Blue-light-activated histidine kinase n=1 Tax=Faunimonas pinastri TaxID=1855383 RepID=A0A1H9LJK9_9HYPH|nr:CheR family methyltransferase [Faunimonas pinastri]SER11093.1 two-component system, chemotaxis family, CheB/CheR fusion protein [Faunimonas pinastri]
MDQHLREPSQEQNQEGSAKLMAVVGVGVCVASLRSLEALFAELDSTTGAAYLIAVRQQEGLTVEAVLDVLKRQSSLEIDIARDGEKLEPNHVYVGGPDDMIAITDGHLRIHPAREPVGHRGTIDSMLISLAEHAHDRAIAVLLSGLGSDGTAGVVATKTLGGLSIAELVEGQEPKAQGSADPAAVADLHLPINRIPTEIRRYASTLSLIGGSGGKEEVPEEIEAQVTQVATILRNTTSHDFHGYKRGTFIRRIQRRLQVTQTPDVETYIARLRSDRDEVQNLFQDLLIGVTQFFRDPQEFDALEREIPRLFKNKGPGDQVRVWVLGCATGEEAYSIAILLREHMATLNHPPEVQIFATDLDARALNLARAGRYTHAIAPHIRPDRLERWFVREGDTYCVTKELREICIFSPHNIVKDAPFSRVDILSCRNLLIYLNTELQNRVIPIFHFSLVPGGVLFLGSSENVTRHNKLFAPIDRKSRVFRRLETATRILPSFPLTPRTRATEMNEAAPPVAPVVNRLTAAISRQAEAVAERFAPAYVVVDTQYDVLHFSGRTGRYLEPSAGAASLNILNLVHRELRLDLRSALQRASAEGRRVELPGLVLQQDGRPCGVNIAVEPIGNSDIASFVVLFQDTGPVSDGAREPGDRSVIDEHVQRLEAELRVTRERLQTTIEELESTNEELKSSNEEYQSINEELQSANEEMETSKEELQSVNEELQTVNGELAHRVSELARINSDLKNLLESTQIATVFLDNDLRVRNFTPTAVDVFHLLETDVGRPLDHVVSRVSYPELADDVRRVLKTLVPIAREVRDARSERQFAASVLPYRSVDNYINGAVVTFTELTALNRAEAALRESEERFRAYVNASSDAVYRMSADWSEMFQLSGQEFISDTEMSTRTWMESFIDPADQAAVQAAIDRAIGTRSMFELEHRMRRVDGSLGWAYTRAVPILNDKGELVEWMGAASDVTAPHEAEDAVRESEERLHSLVEGLPQLVWRAVDDGKWTWASRQWAEYTGQSEAESRDWGWLEALHPDDRAAARAAWTKAAEDGVIGIECRICRKSDGSYRWFQTRATPVGDERGAIVEWIGTSTDIDDLRELQERQGVLVGELQHRTRNLIGVVRSLAEKTSRSSTDLIDFRDRFRDRLDALARVQGLLSRLKEHDRVSFDELIRTELSALDASSSRIELEGPSAIRLPSATVQMLAMTLHELATNAVKYGALGQPTAKLAVNWALEPDGDGGRRWLHIEWRETGVAMHPADGDASVGGQGRELIERALPYQLGAHTTYELGPDGVRCTISMPLSTRVTRKDGEHV